MMAEMSGKPLMSYQDISMKTCNRCKIKKPLSEFGKHKGNNDGLQYRCKICRNEEASQSFKKIAPEEKQRRVEQTYKWRRENPQRFKDLQKEYQTKYSKNNRFKRNALQMKRHATQLERTPAWLSKEQLNEIEKFYYMAKELEKVFPWKQHVDHIVPLKGEIVSGLHVPWNLQILSAKENITKGNRYNG
jgi:5-methylcytosine-specific restriction endonuclease McrA